MKRLSIAIGFIVGFLIGGVWTARVVQAQTATPIQIQAQVSHTSCVVAASTTTYCFANDGLYVSLSGAAFIQIGTPTTGVTSFNGRTGAVVPVPSDYPDAVTSVNGKTGAVVISATTSSTTTLQ